MQCTITSPKGIFYKVITVLRLCSKVLFCGGVYILINWNSPMLSIVGRA